MEHGMQAVHDCLKSIVETEGLDHLSRSPFAVYNKVLDVTNDKYFSRLILITLLADAVAKTPHLTQSSLSEEFQEECGLNRSAADSVAALYKELLSPAHRKEWKQKSGSGFDEFCTKPWAFTWKGEGKWGNGVGHIECRAEVEAVLSVQDRTLAETKVQQLLLKNPFSTAEQIREVLREPVQAALEDEFDSYITAEEYYEPVMEDFDDNAESVVEECCRELGLHIDFFVCEGESSSWIPDF